MTFEQVKRRVSLKDFVTHEGIKTKHGRILCPFHDDHDPSMKIFERGFYCFACGAHGDLFDFAAAYWRVDLIEAKARIEEEFGLVRGNFQSTFKETVKSLDKHAELSDAVDALLWVVKALQGYTEKLNREASPDDFEKHARCCELKGRLSSACDDYFTYPDRFDAFVAQNREFIENVKRLKEKYG